MHEYDYPLHTVIQNLYFVRLERSKLFNGRLGLIYHEVIGGWPLFGLPPHTERKRHMQSKLSHYSRHERDIFIVNKPFQLHNLNSKT